MVDQVVVTPSSTTVEVSFQPATGISDAYVVTLAESVQPQTTLDSVVLTLNGNYV